MSKLRNKLTKAEQRRGYILIITVACFVAFWAASGFRTAVGLVLVGYSLYFLYRTLRHKGTRVRSITAALAFFILGGIIMPQPTESSSVAPLTNKQSPSIDTAAAKLAEATKIESERAEKVKREAKAKADAADKELKLANARQIQTAGDLYTVTSIVDGDTIKVRINGTIETIRFIGMDTPETKDPRKPVQCFGKEASSKMQSYAQSKKVRLQADASQGERDKYGRLLRYVFTENGHNIAYEMIKAGYAHEYTYSLPYEYQSQFKSAYTHARETSAGLWSPNTCGGITNQEHPPAAVVQPKPTPTPAPQPKVTPTPAPKPTLTTPSQPSVYYKNCTAARAAGAAPVYTGQPGYGSHLDRDNDGIGCE